MTPTQLLAAKSINVAEGSKRATNYFGGYLQEHIGDNKNLVAPFFYLYDCASGADHALGDKPRDDVAAKLGVNKTDDYAK